ncbi:glycosyltransferase family 2 protein [Nostoc sp. UHCC 0251]|uniref:glycosyltransferase family 2 protein n=1 Tax=Nostoc sp. UHCC 0251 TaxID=3110240 RepID=UPI002B1F0FAC|nr:glycosyltransferase family 2 protein [Nostoc sp. UHCC 0251]
MSGSKPKIIVVTPVKNEDWILDRFLSVTSQFADLIIIADQNSTDGSKEICNKYPKVKLIENQLEQYDEASRQILLLQTARQLVPDHKIILALDADEIMAANAIHTIGWQTMLKAQPGTILCFEKPDLYLKPEQCIRYDVAWPLGYVDDGVEHQPKRVHSIRIPIPDNAPRLDIHDVKIIHYAITRLTAQSSKWRMYSVIENIYRVNPLFRRRKSYSSVKNWTQGGTLQKACYEWFEGWERSGIDMKTIINYKYYWQDVEVIKYFHKYGIKRFWLDDIWNFNWEACRLYAQQQGIQDIPSIPIQKPPLLLKVLMAILDQVYTCLATIKNIGLSIFY